MCRQSWLKIPNYLLALVAGLALVLCLAACGPAALPKLTALDPQTPTAALPGSPAPLASSTPASSASPEAMATQPAATSSVAPTTIANATLAPTDGATATASPAALALTPDAQAATRRVRLPILMYHYVEPWPAGASLLRMGLTVQPADFQAQMAYLHSQGFVTVSLYDLMAALEQGQPLPAKAVVLTFDDGYRTLVDYAAPALKPYGYTGTVFVITQLMDQDFAQYLTWPQAEALYAAGWKIEPHTKTHPVLAGRDRAYQLYEIFGSIQTVQAHIGTMPRFFNYPYGKFDSLTLSLVKQMNLWGAVTEYPGSQHDYPDRYVLHRVRIDGTMSLKDFIQTIKNAQ